jgi:hypothetical protein
MDGILPATRIKQALQARAKTADSTAVQDQALQVRAKTPGSTVVQDQALQVRVKTAGSTAVEDQTLQARVKTAGSTVEERRFQRRVSHPELKRALAPEVGKLFTGNWQLGTGNCLYEHTMNCPCGKNSHTPAPSPSLLRIQPMVFLS